MENFWILNRTLTHIELSVDFIRIEILYVFTAISLDRPHHSEQCTTISTILRVDECVLRIKKNYYLVLEMKESSTIFFRQALDNERESNCGTCFTVNQCICVVGKCHCERRHPFNTLLKRFECQYSCDWFDRKIRAIAICFEREKESVRSTDMEKRRESIEMVRSIWSLRTLW